MRRLRDDIHVRWGGENCHEPEHYDMSMMSYIDAVDKPVIVTMESAAQQSILHKENRLIERVA
jgi:hypothetical protein